MEKRKLRGAIIGCGYFGGIQIEAWRRMQDVEITAACDWCLERAEAAAPHAYTDAAAMMEREKPDFVDIATRPNSHLALIRLALERRIPVICQKPMAEDLQQAKEIVRLAQSSGVPVMIHENWRWQPWYREAKRRIEQSEIGAPLAYSFRLRQRDGLGEAPYKNQPYFVEMRKLLIYETLIHPIDTARFLFGHIHSVFAQARRYNPRIQGEDRAIVLLSHDAGTDGVIDGHRFSDPDPPGPAMGEAIFEGEAGTLKILASGDIYRNGELVWRNTVQSGYRGDSVFATQRHFIDCLKEGKPFETGATEYFASFAAAEAAYFSVAEGRRIDLEGLLQ